MAIVEQRQKLFKAKIALALYDVLGRVPKEKELRQVSRLTRLLCKAVPELH